MSVRHSRVDVEIMASSKGWPIGAAAVELMCFVNGNASCLPRLSKEKRKLPEPSAYLGVEAVHDAEA